MAIDFKCSCGTGLSVPDDTAGREAFCPTCRKKVPVPAAGLEPIPSAAPDGREASEFRPGALARLLETNAAAPSAAPAKAPPTAPAAPPAPPPPAAAKAQPTTKPPQAPGIEVFPDKVKFHCDCGQKVSVKLPASHAAGKCPKCGRELKVPKLPAEAPRPAAGSDKPAPKDRVNCLKCGRLIEDLSAAFCPRCGFPLVLRPPIVTVAATPASPPAPPPAPAQTPDAEVRQRNAREAAEAAAGLLRPAGAREAASAAPAPAGLVRRLAASGLDLLVAAAAALLSARLASPSLEAEPLAAISRPAAALIGGGAYLLLNEVIFAAAAGGRSLGMLICGVTLFNSSGRPAGALILSARLLTWPLWPIGSPLALFNPQRRTLRDLICGTTLRQTTRE